MNIDTRTKEWRTAINELIEQHSCCKCFYYNRFDSRLRCAVNPTKIYKHKECIDYNPITE